MSTQANPNIDAFQKDVVTNGGYQYTTNAPISAQFANERLTIATLQAASLENKKLLDIGCGDGTYSFELLNRGRASSILGIDPASEAITIANKKAGSAQASFQVASAYDLPFADNSFDVAILRGVLHHLEFPEKAISESLRVAKEIIVIEPNGYNPVLKIIEKLSKYHREHDEKSYSASKLFAWVNNSQGKVEKVFFAGLVPFFSPNWMAHCCKLFEGIIEKTPLIRNLCCAVCVLRAKSYQYNQKQKSEAA